jgi:hypothetical protein
MQKETKMDEFVRRALGDAAESLGRLFTQFGVDIRVSEQTMHAPKPLNNATAGRPYIARAGARDPNSTRGKVRSVVEAAGSKGLTFADLQKALLESSPESLRAHISVLIHLGEVERKGDCIVWRG